MNFKMTMFCHLVVFVCNILAVKMDISNQICSKNGCKHMAFFVSLFSFKEFQIVSLRPA